jgi:hypothetical protein
MATLQEQFVVDAKGRKTGVILSLKRYQRLMEDLHDLAVVAERRSEEPISLDDMKRRLKKDGLLKKGVRHGCEENFDDRW